MSKKSSRASRFVFAAVAATLVAAGAFLAHEARAPRTTSTVRQNERVTRVVMPAGLPPLPDEASAVGPGTPGPGMPEIPQSTVATLATMPETPPVYPEHIAAPRIPAELARQLEQR